MGQSAPAFVDALCSRAPTSAADTGMSLYAWLVGRWELDAVLRRPDGSTDRKRGFVSAGWVLEGRAIQDVFALPDLFYGSTLRVYDSAIDAWHCHWSDPLHQVYFQMIGRSEAGEIVNEGLEPESLGKVYGVKPIPGSPAILRWIFSDISDSTFRWRSERSLDGKSWQLQRQYLARRLLSSA
ncbi:MAG: hypothetical protein ACRD2G_14205 [Terriglobia bacterium]